MSARAALLLAFVAASCAREDAADPIQVFDLGPVADGLSTRDPILRRAGAGLELEYVAGGERRVRAWPARADRLGAERPADGARGEDGEPGEPGEAGGPHRTG